MKQKVSEKIEQISNGILAMAGIFASPSKNAKPVGNSKSGAPVFVSPEIAGSADTRSGANFFKYSPIVLCLSPQQVYHEPKL